MGKRKAMSPQPQLNMRNNFQMMTFSTLGKIAERSKQKVLARDDHFKVTLNQIVTGTDAPEVMPEITIKAKSAPFGGLNGDLKRNRFESKGSDESTAVSPTNLSRTPAKIPCFPKKHRLMSPIPQ